MPLVLITSGNIFYVVHIRTLDFWNTTYDPPDSRKLRADKVWADPPAVGYIPMLILVEEWIGTLFFPVDKLQIFFLLGKGSGRRRPRRRTEKGPMEIQHHRGVGNSKVVKVQSEEAWDLFTNQASNEGRPVGSPSFPSLLCPGSFALVEILFIQFSKLYNDPF